MKFVLGASLASLPPQQAAIAKSEEALSLAALALAQKLGVPNDDLPQHMLSVAATLLIRTAAALMAMPEGTEPMCKWVKEFGEQFPIYVAQMATHQETKQ